MDNYKWDLSDFFKNEDECLLKLKDFEKLASNIKMYGDNLDNPRYVYDFFEFEELIEIVSQKFTFYFSMLEHENYKNFKLGLLKDEYERIKRKLDSYIIDVKKKIKDLDYSYLYKIYPRLIKYRSSLKECSSNLDEDLSALDKQKHAFEIYSSLMNDISGSDDDPLKYSSTIASVWDLCFKTLSSDPDYLKKLAYSHDCELADLNFMFEKIVSKSDINLDIEILTSDMLYGGKKKFDLKQSKKIILDSLSVLGDEYTGEISRIFSSRHIDYFPRENKVKQNLTFTYPLLPSRAIINFKGNFSSTLVLAHELGHMAEFNFRYKNGFIDSSNMDMGVEFYSLFNELIVANYMFARANTLDEKIEYMFNILEIYYENLITSAYNVSYFANVFEDVKNGQALNPAYLNKQLYAFNDRFNIDFVKDGWADFELSEDLLECISYFFGIIGASKASFLVQNKTFDSDTFMKILKSDFDGFTALNSLDCNPYESLDFALDEYDRLIQNSKDLLYEKEKILRRYKWK